MKLGAQFLTPVKYLLSGQLMHMGLYFLAAPTCAVASYLSSEFINETFMAPESSPRYNPWLEWALPLCGPGPCSPCKPSGL